MTDQTPKPRLWLRILLFVSLAANLLVVGLVVGLAFHRDDDNKRRHPPRPDQIGGPLTHALSPEDRREIGRAIWQEYRADRPNRDSFRAEYDAVLDALRSVPFDRTVVEQSLQRQIDFATQRQRIGQRILLERLTTMSDDERAAFADRLEEGMRRWNERREAKSRDKD